MADPIGVNSPVRLLREDWKTPRALAEELYAMFTAKEGPVVNGPITIRVPQGQEPIQVQRVEAGDTFQTINKRPSTLSSPTPTSAPAVQARRPAAADTSSARSSAASIPLVSRSQAPEASPDDSSLFAQQTLEFEAGIASTTTSGPSPIQFSAPAPVSPVIPSARQEPVVEQLKPRQPDSNLVVPPVGTIVSGFGQTYQVQLQNNGPIADPSGLITVTFTMLDEEEIIDAGTLIWDIRQYAGIYYGFIPTWG